MSVSNTKQRVHPQEESIVIDDVLSLFRKLLPASSLQKIEREEGVKRYRDRLPIYTTLVVVWLMLFQRLDAKHTLSSVVKKLKAGTFSSLHDGAWQKKCGQMSCDTSGYSQARIQLPLAVILRVVDKLLRALFDYIDSCGAKTRWNGYRVFLVDGSCLLTAHTRDILKCFSQGRNERGKSYLPVIRVLTMHDLLTGIALRPEWGSAYGAKTIGEQGLFKRQIKRLFEKAIIVGDRNFGIFAVVYHAVSHDHQVVIRMTKSRAMRLLKINPKRKPNSWITWTPSRWDLANNPEIPKDTAIKGRLIQVTIRPKPKAERIKIYIFTTLKHSEEKIIQLYGKRWSIETDLRSIKSCVDMDFLNVRSAQMVQKKLITGFAAYSLVRAIMTLAATQTGVSPRDLSFSQTIDVIHAYLPTLQNTRTPTQLQQLLEAMMLDIASGRISKPKKKRKNQPRVVRRKKATFPTSNKSRQVLERLAA